MADGRTVVKRGRARRQNSDWSNGPKADGRADWVGRVLGQAGEMVEKTDRMSEGHVRECLWDVSHSLVHGQTDEILLT